MICNTIPFVCLKFNDWIYLIVLNCITFNKIIRDKAKNLRTKTYLFLIIFINSLFRILGQNANFDYTLYNTRCKLNFFSLTTYRIRMFVKEAITCPSNYPQTQKTKKGMYQWICKFFFFVRFFVQEFTLSLLQFGGKKLEIVSERPAVQNAQNDLDINLPASYATSFPGISIGKTFEWKLSHRRILRRLSIVFIEPELPWK